MGPRSSCFAGCLVSVIWFDIGGHGAPKAELFGWITITFSQTLGTALGDWTANTGNLGFIGAPGTSAGLFFVLALLPYGTNASRMLLFGAVLILTHPPGAAVGDFLNKPLDRGGLAVRRLLASVVLTAAILPLIVVPSQPAGEQPGQPVDDNRQ